MNSRPVTDAAASLTVDARAPAIVLWGVEVHGAPTVRDLVTSPVLDLVVRETADWHEEAAGGWNVVQVEPQGPAASAPPIPPLPHPQLQ